MTMTKRHHETIALFAALYLWVSIAAFGQVPNTPERTQLLTSGQTHNHPIGLAFRYPAGWKTQQTAEGLTLTPPNAVGETYLILTEAAEGISRPDAPELIQTLDTQITSLAPFLKRVGVVEQVQTDAGAGAQITWEGRNPEHGVDVRSYVFITLSKGHVVYFVATATEERLEALTPMLRAIFSTFGSSAASTPNPMGNPLAVDPYVGVFKGEQMQVEFAASGGGVYKGTIHFNGQEFPLEGRKSGPSMQGTFQAQGTPFEFTSSLSGTTLTFSTGGTTYTLQKQVPPQPANPLAMPGQQPANPLLKPQRQGGKTFKHPIGISFWYPDGWQAQQTEAGVQVVPPDATSNAQGPTEVYLVTAEAAQGITRADDPQLVQYLNTQLLSILPFMQRTGEIEPVQTPNGQGALITWEGQNPTGMSVQARVFAIVLKDYGVALVGLGDKAQIAKREPVLREIFASFEFSAPQIDTRFVGTWKHESIYSSGDFSSTSVQYKVFRPDGTFSSGGRMMFSSDAGTGDTGESAGDTGRWVAANEKLILTWNDGSRAEYGFYIQGQPGSQEMLLKPTNGDKNQLWTQVR